LYALDHLPAVLPWKQMNAGSFFWELFDQSMNALQLIALQNRGVPGRKNIIWVGRGGPGVAHSVPNGYIRPTSNCTGRATALTWGS
jgi:hypothetical protein